MPKEADPRAGSSPMRSRGLLALSHRQRAACCRAGRDREHHDASPALRVSSGDRRRASPGARSTGARTALRDAPVVLARPPMLDFRDVNGDAGAADPAAVCEPPKLGCASAAVTVHEEDDDVYNDNVYCNIATESPGGSELRITPKTPNLDEGQSHQFSATRAPSGGSKLLAIPMAISPSATTATRRTLPTATASSSRRRSSS